jgi:hypothetical protein
MGFKVPRMGFKVLGNAVDVFFFKFKYNLNKYKFLKINAL